MENLSSLPFVDVLYIRCDWRDVQTRPGRLDLHPVFKLTLDAARRRRLRVGFRIQMSNTEGQPGRLAIPEFLQKQVPLVKIGKTYGTIMRHSKPLSEKSMSCWRESLTIIH